MLLVIPDNCGVFWQIIKLATLCRDWYPIHLRSLGNYGAKRSAFKNLPQWNTRHMELKVNSIFFFYVLFLKLCLIFNFLAPQAPSIKGVSSVENNVFDKVWYHLVANYCIINMNFYFLSFLKVQILMEKSCL